MVLAYNYKGDEFILLINNMVALVVKQLIGGVK